MNAAAPDPVPLPGLARRLRLAWAVVLVERLWPLLVPPVCVLGLFLAYALFDPVPVVPGWLHLTILVLTVLAVTGLLVRAIRRLRLPDREDAARRLERDSGLDHRPLAVLGDQPVGDDPAAASLWQAHLRRTLARLGPLRLDFPRSDMAARDPWGLRAAVLLLLVVAVTGAWGDVPRRLGRALDLSAAAGMAPDTIEVWLTPPAHSGLSPLVLRPGRDGAVAVPQGTAVLALLSGGWGQGRLRLGDHDAVDFQRQPDGGRRAEARLEVSGWLAVRQGLFTVAEWPVTVTPDAPPVVAFAQPPEPGERGRLHLALTASDDYGLARVWVAVSRPGEEPLDLPLGLAPGTREARPGGWIDLSAHAWAGLPVTLTPMAADGAGQVMAGEPVATTLPERRFLNPVAAAVVAQRRALTVSPREEAHAVAAFLDHLGPQPELFNDDLRAFLMLRAARHDLLSRDGFLLSEVRDLLWHGALRIEDGDLSAAERALDEARAALESALDRGASADEMRALLDQFQQAVARLLQAAGTAAEPTPTGDGVMLGADEVMDMVEHLRDLAEGGSRDALRQALEQMGKLLGNLGGGGQGSGAAVGLRQLRDLAARQQALQDDSAARARDRVAADGGAARAQKDLHRALAETARDLAEAMGEPPAALGDAAQAMESAADSLARGDWDGAAEAQGRAVAALRAAIRDTAAKAGGRGGGGGLPRDPLGRALRGAAPGDDGATRVPAQSELQRSRQLMEEIRRRAGETTRPEAERDYLRRLLRQF